MEQAQRIKLATKAWNAVKRELLRLKPIYENDSHRYTEYDHRNPTQLLEVGCKHGYYGAKNERYRLYIQGTWPSQDGVLIEVETLQDLKDTIMEFSHILREQTKKRGWGRLTIVYDKTDFGCYFSHDYVNFPSKITLCDEPCKEFKELQSYINKHGVCQYSVTRKYELKNFTIFNSHMSGKNGELRNEWGERTYLDHRSMKCAKVLAELREHYAPKDTMICSDSCEDYINPIDRNYSEWHGCECEGERRHYLTIKIQDAKGNLKHELKIY